MVTTFERGAMSRRSDAAAARFRVIVTRTARRLRQESQYGLSAPLVSALVAVHRFGPLTPSELAEREGVARPGASRTAAALEERGLVRREADAADRRSHTLAATPEGEALLAAARRRSSAYLESALAKLDEEELEVLERAAALLERALEVER
jgi:DNA-binding MarR family transcriptional regulator